MKKPIVLIAALVFALSACKSTKEPVIVDLATNENVKSILFDADKFNLLTRNFIKFQAEEEFEDIDGIYNVKEGYENPLTGLEMAQKYNGTRPFAVVFNNLDKALPQSGISQAEYTYEVLAEGGVTRIIGLSHNYSSEKIGPIRSTRDYFLNFALDNDAVFVHHGGSPQGYAFIQNNGINNLDGMALEGFSFYRDQKRINERGYEHSSYTSGEGIVGSRDNYGYRNAHSDFTYSQQFESSENFYETADDAKDIEVNYSNYQRVEFKLNDEDGLYYRWQRDEVHYDEMNDEQLSVKNIFIQYVNSKVIDNEGRLEVDMIGNGWGYYFTNGKYIKCKWFKSDKNSPTKWAAEDGSVMKINRGKTWVCVVDDGAGVNIK